MRTSSSTRVPKYRVHKTWGLGVVRVNGKDVYCSVENTGSVVKMARMQEHGEAPGRSAR